VGKPERKITLGIPRGMWEDNIKKCILEKYNRTVWTGFIWLRIGSSGELL
jgi:hypothetical protein